MARFIGATILAALDAKNGNCCHPWVYGIPAAKVGSACIQSRRARLRILPTGVFGRLSLNSTILGRL